MRDNETKETRSCESRLHGGTCSGILSVMIRREMKIRCIVDGPERVVMGVGAANACHFKETLKFILGESDVVT